MVNEIFFKPYIGDLYGNPKNIFNGKKVLVIGHNHNCTKEREPKRAETICRRNCLAQNEECHDKTVDTIESFIGYIGKKCKRTILRKIQPINEKRPSFSNTFTNFGNFLTNYEKSFTLLDAFDSIAFYNYCQFAVSEWAVQPLETPEINHYKDSEGAFLKILEVVSPDIVLVWSIDKVFNKLPQCHFDSQLFTTDFNRKYGVKKYNINNKDITVVGIQHPMAFSPNKWHRIIFPRYLQLR